MAFEVLWTERARKSLSGMQRDDVIRIIKKVEAVKADPYRFLKKLVGEKAWRLRVGDWRVLVDMDSENERLHVLEVGHRKKVYESL
jgi:mRNA interferase RelE/StbE